jgi:hypothetical protein
LPTVTEAQALLFTTTWGANDTLAYASYRTWFGVDDTVPHSWTSSPAFPAQFTGLAYKSDISYVGGGIGASPYDFSAFSVRLVAP